MNQGESQERTLGRVARAAVLVAHAVAVQRAEGTRERQRPDYRGAIGPGVARGTGAACTRRGLRSSEDADLPGSSLAGARSPFEVHEPCWPQKPHVGWVQLTPDQPALHEHEPSSWQVPWKKQWGLHPAMRNVPSFSSPRTQILEKKRSSERETRGGGDVTGVEGTLVNRLGSGGLLLHRWRGGR